MPSSPVRELTESNYHCVHVFLQITADDVKSYENAKLLASDSRKNGKYFLVDQGLCRTCNLLSAGRKVRRI